jgi:inward rectifier potassium channel
MTGVAGLALATSLLFGRFARPSARLGFSEHMVVAPYIGGSSLQFRTVNRRKNNIIELEARVLLMTEDGALKLELDRVGATERLS